MPAEVASATAGGYRVLELRAGSLQATVAPEAGLVTCSLHHRGEEVLGQRNGLRGYVERGSTMGIPLLHPWANRLAGRRYTAAGRTVEIPDGVPRLKLDPNGLPIHGVMTAAAGWEVTESVAAAGVARLEARFDFAAEELLAAFPFPHALRQRMELTPDRLTIVTELIPTGDVEVPVAFGYHPYLTLPGVPRAEWEIDVPVSTRLPTDERGIPTGAREPARVEPGRLGERTYDDGFADLRPGGAFVLAGGGRRIELRFDAASGYPCSQLYAPEGQDLIAYEPMTAPTNALCSGDGLRTVAPGQRFEASFSIAVGDD